MRDNSKCKNPWENWLQMWRIQLSTSSFTSWRHHGNYFDILNYLQGTDSKLNHAMFLHQWYSYMEEGDWVATPHGNNTSVPTEKLKSEKVKVLLNLKTHEMVPPRKIIWLCQFPGYLNLFTYLWSFRHLCILVQLIFLLHCTVLTHEWWVKTNGQNKAFLTWKFIKRYLVCRNCHISYLKWGKAEVHHQKSSISCY